MVLSSGHLNQWYLVERGKRKGKRENDVLDNLSKGVKRAPSSHGHSSKGWANEAEESLDCAAVGGCMDRLRGRMEELVAGPRDGVFQAKIRKALAMPLSCFGRRWGEEGVGRALKHPFAEGWKGWWGDGDS